MSVIKLTSADGSMFNISYKDILNVSQYILDGKEMHGSHVTYLDRSVSGMTIERSRFPLESPDEVKALIRNAYAEEKTASDDPFKKQVGGDHYKKLAIQPVVYIHKNNIGFCAGSAITYLTRWQDKGGVEDLKKAKHFIELLIEMEEKK